VSEVQTEVEALRHPAPPSQDAFIHEQLREGSKFAEQLREGSKFADWILGIVLAWLVFDGVSAMFVGPDDLLQSAGRLPYLVGAAIIMATISGLLRAIRKIRTQPRTPGGNGPVIATLVVAELCILGAVIYGIFVLSRPDMRSPRGKGQEGKPSATSQTARGASSPKPTSDGRMREWRLREPEISMPVTVPSGVRATFRLVLQDNGAPETIWEKEITGPAEKPALFELGTQLRYVSGPPGAIQELVVEWTARQGGSLHSGRDLRGWKFNGGLPAKITLSTPGHQEYVLATLVADGKPPRNGTLTLEVTVEPVKGE
jgi:hypothetical protein